MKKLLVIAALLGTAVIAAPLPAARATIIVPIQALLYRWDGPVCQPNNGCRFFVQRESTGSTWDVGVGSLIYCGPGGGPYWHFQYGATNCTALPFWYNAYKNVSSDSFGTAEYFRVWMRQTCSGGGFHYSASRRIYVPFKKYLPVYAGSLQPGSACLAGAPAA